MLSEPAFSAALLHLDTGKPHPFAAVSTLVQSLTAKRTEGWSFAMSVTGSYLAVLFQNFTADYDAEDWTTRTDWNEQEDTLVVWNWHKGERMMVSFSTPRQAAGFDSLIINTTSPRYRLSSAVVFVRLYSWTLAGY